MQRGVAEFTNWSGQYKSTPAAFVSPKTPAELQWDRFKEAREDADPDRRFLSGYFKTLMYGDTQTSTI